MNRMATCNCLTLSSMRPGACRMPIESFFCPVRSHHPALVIEHLLHHPILILLRVTLGMIFFHEKVRTRISLRRREISTNTSLMHVPLVANCHRLQGAKPAPAVHIGSPRLSQNYYTAVDCVTACPANSTGSGANKAPMARKPACSQSFSSAITAASVCC